MRKKIKIAPSILAANHAKLGSEVARVESAGADWLHIDIMDGHFVPNLSFSAQAVKALRPASRLVFDVHLMISEPGRYIDDFIDAGADYITVHYEAAHEADELLRLSDYIHSKGLRVGLSLKPATHVEEIKTLLGAFDLVLIMTVEPGFGAQPYMCDMENKIRKLSAVSHREYPNLEIGVDGGINKETIASAARAGITVAVSGSAIFEADDASAAIRDLRKAAEEAGTE